MWISGIVWNIKPSGPGPSFLLGHSWLELWKLSGGRACSPASCPAALICAAAGLWAASCVRHYVLILLSQMQKQGGRTSAGQCEGSVIYHACEGLFLPQNEAWAPGNMFVLCSPSLAFFLLCPENCRGVAVLSGRLWREETTLKQKAQHQKAE